MITGRIAGFAEQDAIRITGFVADPAIVEFARNVLTLHQSGGTGLAELHFAPGLSLADFLVTPDGAGGTLVIHG